MDIRIVLSEFSAWVANITVEVYEAVNPTALVDSQTFSPPHTSSRPVVFTGRDNLTHLIKVIGAPSTNLVNPFYYQPRITSMEVKAPLFFKIGDGGTDTPPVDTTSYRNTQGDLKDWEYWVERRGLGTAVEDQGLPYKEITKIAADPDYGFDLQVEEDSFNADEIIIIHFVPRPITNLANESVTGKWFSGTTTIITDTAYSSAHLRKLLLLRKSGGGILTYTLPEGSLMPIGYALAFNTFGDAATYKIQRAGSNLIEYGGGNVAFINLLQNQFIVLIWNGTIWEVIVKSDTNLQGFSASDDPDLDNSAVLATTKATKVLADRILILGAGVFPIPQGAIGGPGDIQGGTAALYTVTHNLHISGNYIVMGSWKSNSTNHWRDDAITWCFYDASADSFKLQCEELHAEAQNVSFCWMLVKV